MASPSFRPRSICITTLVAAIALALLPHAARADGEPKPRFAIGYSFGYTQTVVEKLTLGQHPKAWPIGTSMGVGIDFRGGLQLTRWLAIDAQIFGESLLFFGQGRVAALVEVKPIESFAVSAGVGYGQIYLMNFNEGFKTSNYAMAILRPEVVWSSGGTYSVGPELQLGRTTGGTAGPGHLVFGGRAVFSILFR